MEFSEHARVFPGFVLWSRAAGAPPVRQVKPQETLSQGAQGGFLIDYVLTTVGMSPLLISGIIHALIFFYFRGCTVVSHFEVINNLIEI